MNNINLISNSGSTEETTSAVLGKLYDTYFALSSGTVLMPQGSSLKGRVHLSITRTRYKLFLESISGLTDGVNNFIVNADELYIDFEDSVAELKLATSYGDGVGLTQTQINAITSLPNSYFKDTNITSLRELSQFTNLASIGKLCFNNCSSLQYLTLPNRQINLDLSYTFSGSAIKNLDLSNCTTVGNDANGAFYNMTALEELKLPSTGITRTRIWTDEFKQTTSLNSLVMDYSAITTIDNGAFMSAFANTTSEVRLTFSSCTSLGWNYTFTSSGIAELSFPAFSGMILTNNGYDLSAFSGMHKLKKISFGHATEVRGGRVGSGADRRFLAECYALKVVDFGDSITALRVNSPMLDGTNSVAALIFRCTTPPTLQSWYGNSNPEGGTAMTQISQLCGSNRPWIFVPDSTNNTVVDAYKTAWPFAELYIRPLSEYVESDYITWQSQS